VVFKIGSHLLSLAFLCVVLLLIALFFRGFRWLALCCLPLLSVALYLPAGKGSTV
jgi:predicted exporter